MPRLQGRIDLDGAVINVRVETGEAEAAYLRSMNQPVPEPFATTALIDTGASHTAVAPVILQNLGIRPRGYASVVVPGQGESATRTHDTRIALGPHRRLFEVEAVNVLPATHTVFVLIGRDILERCTLLFDGENKVFSLWF